MKKSFLVALFMLVITSFGAYCQTTNWRYISKENVALKIPEGWKIKTAAKPKGNITMTAKSEDGKCFVEIKGIRVKVNLSNRATDIAALRSQKDNFQYMQIDKANKTKFKNFDAQLLNYTNTFENDVYKGVIYAFVNEGYTYTIEYYGEDNPETIAFLNEIVNTVNVNATEDKTENIKSQEKKFDADNWHKEEIDVDAIKAEQEAEKARLQAEKELQRAQQKEAKKQEEAQKELEKQQKQAAKAAAKEQAQRIKAEKAQLKAEEAAKKAEQKREKAEKERRRKELNIDGLQARSKTIEKELNKIADKQLKLNEDYGKAQQKEDTQQMEKIKSQQDTLLKKIKNLNEEKSDIDKQLSKF